jgi:hypothetical protein
LAGSPDIDPATLNPFIPNLQGEAAQLMDDILTPFQVDFNFPNKQ